MPPLNKKTNKKRRNRNVSFKSNVMKKPATKTMGKKFVEEDELDNEKSPLPLRIDDGIGDRIFGNKLRNLKDKDSLEFKSEVTNILDYNDLSSESEDIIDSVSTKSPCKSEMNTQESDGLETSINQFKISQSTDRITRSQMRSHSFSKIEEKPNPRLLVRIERVQTPNEDSYRILNSIQEAAVSSVTSSLKKKDITSTPIRQTRRSRVTNYSNTPYGTPSISSMTLRRSKIQLSEKSERCLRERNSKEDSPTTDRKPQVKSQVEKEQEVNETPRKRVRAPKSRFSSRISPAAVNEESNENNPSHDYNTSDDFIPNSQKNIEKKNTRSRKNVADKNNDYIYGGSSKKYRSLPVVETPKSRRISTTRKSTPMRDVTQTPKRTTMTSRGRSTLTPGMQQRSANVPKPKTNFEEFRARLHVSFVPKSLPCREEEFNNIFTFLQSKLTEETGGCIYISGVPGTGKTATVNEVMSCLKKLESQGELPNFQFVDINGLKVTEARQAYVEIHKRLNGVTTSWEEAHLALHQRFTIPAPRRNMTLLLVDEMDLLCTKRQDVVYNLFDWPTYKASRLVVITIANTMDLPERVLMGRVTSRLGLTRLTFQPYSFIQLMEIVKTRLKDSDAFKSEAIELVARKVASVSGDARRALDICRRATEIAENNNKDCVTMPDVTSALAEMIANPRVKAIKCCSIMERNFLEAICSEVSRTGVDQVTFKFVYRQFETLYRLEGMEVPNITQALEICRKLASWRVILQESGADLYQRIMLNVSADDVYFSKQKL